MYSAVYYCIYAGLSDLLNKKEFSVVLTDNEKKKIELR